MELQKKSELSVGRSSFVISTQLEGDASPSIETRVVGSDGTLVFQTSQDVTALKPIFQNSQKVFARLEAQHHAVMQEVERGRIGSSHLGHPRDLGGPSDAIRESDALAHAVDLLGKRSFDKATAALRAVLETYPNCSEARELLEVTYRASAGGRLPIDLASVLKRGSEAFAEGRQREAIESWKQCLADEPENRRLQILVLLATTWSPERRQAYAAEILAPGNRFLSSGRPEEAQALLLVTQTAETGTSARGKELSETRVSPPPSELEALVSDFVEAEAHATAPGLPPPPPVARPTESPETRELKEAREGKPEPPRSSPREPRPGLTRKPPPPHRGLPWGILGAVAGVLIALVAGILWWVSRDQTISPAVLERAAGLVSAGNYPQAIDAYDEILARYGESAEVYLGRGRAKLASGDVTGGLVDLERAFGLDPDSPAIAEEIADLFYSQGRYPDAISYYEKAFAKGEGGAEGRYRVAVSLMRERRGDEAMQHLGAALAKDPSHGEAQFLYGQLLNERGRYEEAEKLLREAEQNLEAGGDYLNELGISLLEQQKLEAAEEVALGFLRAYPSDARARALLGEVYLSRKQYEPARAQLIQALRNNPHDPRAQLALGRTWLAIAKLRGDENDLSKAQQVLASAQGVHEGRKLLALGQVAIAAGNLEESRNLLQRGLEGGAPELPVRLSLAEAKWIGKDMVGAAEELQRASGLAPGDPAVALSLAIAYFQLKDPSRAADQFLKAIQGIGMVSPPGEGSGPVVLPSPHIPVPDRFNVNRAIRESCQTVLKGAPEDPTATQLTTLSESATFLIDGT